MRTSAADRDRVIEMLKAAYGEGRLTKDELDTRIERAVCTGTFADLAEVVRDLPGGERLGLPSYPQPRYYGAARAPTNGLAIESLICSLFGFLPFVPSVASIVMGHVAHSQIRRGGQRGYGVATAGLIFGYLGLIGWLLVLAFIAAVTAHTGTAISPGPGPG